ncbi:MAG: AraC family transcriptional regulator [Pseudomonadota bacterium]
MKRSALLSSLCAAVLLLSVTLSVTAPATGAEPSPFSRTPAQPAPSPFSRTPAPPAAAPSAAPAPDAPPAAVASEPAAPIDTRGLDEEIQTLKKDVVDLNRDLFVLEEELLFPANTQVAVFLSMDVGDFFALDTVELRIDDKQVTKYLYTPREAEALLKGGVQRLYLGNLKLGGHELVALFTGKGPKGADYSRGAQLKFEKAVGAKYLELTISDRQRKLQPEFEIKDWE